MESKKEERPARKKKGPLRPSPDINELIPIRVDSNTVFYIKKGQDVEKARARFTKRYMEGMLSVEKRIHINNNAIKGKSTEKGPEGR